MSHDPLNLVDPNGTDDNPGAVVHGYGPGTVGAGGNMFGHVSSGGISLPDLQAQIDALMSYFEDPIVVVGHREKNSGPVVLPNLPTQACTGRACIMQGNSNLIGSTNTPFNTPKNPVTTTRMSAAVIPSQWTNTSNVGPVMRRIGASVFGYVITTTPAYKIQYFNRLTDRVNDYHFPDVNTAERGIMGRAPGQLVLEIVGGEHFGKDSFVMLYKDPVMGCPEGTTRAL